MRSLRRYLVGDKVVYDDGEITVVVLGYRGGEDPKGLLVHRGDGRGWSIHKSDINSLLPECREDAHFLVSSLGADYSGFFVSEDSLGEVKGNILRDFLKSDSYRVSAWLDD